MERERKSIKSPSVTCVARGTTQIAWRLSYLLLGHGELKDNVLSSQLLVGRGECVQLVLEGGVVLSVEEDLDDF